MNRLPQDQVSPEALQSMTSFHQSVVQEVSSKVSTERVVIVGMAQNPFVGKARKAFTQAGIPFTYLEYGSYWSQWKQRLAIKLWSGWPTFPQVFVEGKLIGGYTDARKFLDAGKIKKA